MPIRMHVRCVGCLQLCLQAWQDACLVVRLCLSHGGCPRSGGWGVGMQGGSGGGHDAAHGGEVQVVLLGGALGAGCERGQTGMVMGSVKQRLQWTDSWGGGHIEERAVRGQQVGWCTVLCREYEAQKARWCCWAARSKQVIRGLTEEQWRVSSRGCG